MKTHEKIMVYRGNVARGITGNIFSVKGILFVTFLMKNIFIKFPTPILNHHFFMISSKNAMFSIGFIDTFMMYPHTTIKFATKNMKFSTKCTTKYASK